MKPVVSIALVAAFAFSTAAFAEEATEKQDKNDPNRMICKAEEEIGSRLRSKKTCMTAAQWKEQRRLSRMEIDRNQAGRYKNN